MEKNAKVINIIGGPGAGKTTVASELFSRLKKLNLDVENVSEFAKELVWEDNIAAFSDRLYMHAMQNHRLFMMKNKLDFIITDSPLLLTAIYNNFYLKDKQTKEYNEMINLVTLETFKLYDNVIYLLKRDTDYTTVGRRENKLEADEIDKRIKEYLDNNKIPYKEVSLQNAVDTIYKDIIE